MQHYQVTGTHTRHMPQRATLTAGVYNGVPAAGAGAQDCGLSRSALVPLGVMQTFHTCLIYALLIRVFFFLPPS